MIDETNKWRKRKMESNEKISAWESMNNRLSDRIDRIVDSKAFGNAMTLGLGGLLTACFGGLVFGTYMALTTPNKNSVVQQPNRTSRGNYFIQCGDINGDGIQDLVVKDLPGYDLVEKEGDTKYYVGDNLTGLFTEAHVEKDVDGNLSFVGMDGKTYRIDMQSLKRLEDRLPEKEEGK